METAEGTATVWRTGAGAAKRAGWAARRVGPVKTPAEATATRAKRTKTCNFKYFEILTKGNLHCQLVSRILHFETEKNLQPSWWDFLRLCKTQENVEESVEMRERWDKAREMWMMAGGRCAQVYILLQLTSSIKINIIFTQVPFFSSFLLVTWSFKEINVSSWNKIRQHCDISLVTIVI